MLHHPPVYTRRAVAAGSVAGREHLRLHRNNQDGVAVSAVAGLLVAVVTDGCSSGACSEVGARFAATWLAQRVPEYVRSGAPEAWIAEATAGLLSALAGLAGSLSPSPSRLPSTVNDFLLFSFVAAVVSRERTVVFGAGDGAFSVNERATHLDPGPDNAPGYLAYSLVGRPIDAAVYFDGMTADVRSVAIATDGAQDLAAIGGLEELERDARYMRNSSLLQKRLIVLAERERLLRDDTTIALVRTREACS